MSVWPLIERLGDWQSRRGPLRLRLRDAIADQILSGGLLEGSRLPSERHLSQAIAVSRNTVTSAYALLVEDGLVEQRRGSGSVVRIDRQNTARLLRRSREVEGIFPVAQGGEDGDPIDFCISSVTLPAAFVDTIAFDANDVAALNRQNAYNPYGTTALREAIAQTFTKRGLPTGPQEILVTTGGQQAIDLATRLFVERGDSVAVESPTYFVGLDTLRAAGARLHAMPEYDRVKSLREALIHSNARMVYAIPTLHNPTGRTLSDDERRCIADASAQLQVPVVEDVTLENLRYDGEVPKLIAQFAPAGNTIVLGSLNKEFWSGLRIGWIRADSGTIARLARLKTAADLTTSLWSQAVAVRVFERIDEIRNVRRADLLAKRRVMERLLSEHLGDWAFYPAQGGFCIWARLPVSDARPFVHLARRFGVRIVSGSAMTIDESCADYVRLVFSSEPHAIECGITRLRDAWNAFSHYTPNDVHREQSLAV